MDIKSEIEIKQEEFEDNSYQQSSQIFPDIRANFASGEKIKIEEFNEKIALKSELRDSEEESMLGKELGNTDVIKSENVSPIENKSCAQHLKKNNSLLKKVDKKGLKSHFESDQERFFAQLVMSKSPSVLLKKLSEKELKLSDSNVDISAIPSTSSAPLESLTSTSFISCTSAAALEALASKSSEQRDEMEMVRERLRSTPKSEAFGMILCPGGSSDEELSSDDEGTLRDDPLVSFSLTDTAQFVQTTQSDGTTVEVEDEDEPVRNEGPPAPKRRALATIPKWKKISFVPHSDIGWKDQDQYKVEDSWLDFLPINFFYYFFDLTLFSYIAEQTNLYALQSAGKELKIQADDVKVYIGFLMKMGILRPPSFRYIWQMNSGLEAITKYMRRDKFFELKSFLHFNDKSAEKPRDHPQYDRFQKIRHVFERVRNNCRKLPMEEYHSIGQQIIPTKCHHSFKQYNPNKPHKWGYKIITRAGASGIVYDFLFYEGKGTLSDDHQVGVSSSYVLKLIELLPLHKNYKIFFDSWFSSLPLSKVLQEKGILFVATIQPNRLRGLVFKEEKTLKKEGRGSLDHWTDTTTNTVAIRWYDNKSFHMLSNYAGVEPRDTCRRWDAKDHKYIDIQRPLAIQEYNKYMGGVDLADMLIDLYRINFKSKKWYVRIFYYLLDFCIVNSWLLYRRVEESKGCRTKCMKLVDFKLDVADGLLRSKETVTLRGRSPSTPGGKKTRKIVKHSVTPGLSARYDKMSHWPQYTSERRRCRVCVNSAPKFKCTKCQVNLCIISKQEQPNCFMLYHQQRP